MSNQAKMIIITSNEDLIEQISLNKSEQTRIIDLDPNKSIPSISNDHNDLFDFPYLTQFSELNCQNDQMYKRVLESPRPSRPKIAKTSKKGFDLFCVICEDGAIGFNYDVLTCASCKAFFRRNAQYNPEKLRCLTGEKNCSVTHEIHRKCQRCRLVKCLSMGMRRDFILTEEEKQRRRQRIEENRRLSNLTESSSEIDQNYISNSIDEIDRLLMDTEDENNNVELNNKNLSIEDWSDIESVRYSYLSIFENENELSRYYDVSDRISALISWSKLASERSVKLIQFFRQIEEFENLNGDDRFILIKYNLYPLYLIQRCLSYDPLTREFLNRTTDDSLKCQQFFALCYGTSGVRESYRSLIHSFSIVTEQDSILTYLFLIILLFSKGLSMSETEPILNDQLAVNRAQFHYIRLTWNYLISKQGEMKTSRQFLQLMGQIEKIQVHTKRVRDYFHTQNQSTDIFEKLAPLMQTVLNIS